MTLRRSLKHRILAFVAPRLAYAYMSLLGATSRLTWHGTQETEAIEKSGGNYIYALWHNRQVVFTLSHRGRRVATLVSRSKDGDIIAELLSISGHRPIRGSSSRGGAAALKELVDAGKEGHLLCVTPDGPRGPAFSVQSGVLFLARELGIPIIPAANAMKRKIVLRSWDKFQFPLPFNRLAIVYGPGIRVHDGDDLAAKAEELRLAIDAVTSEADGLMES